MTKIARSGSGSESESISQRHGSADPDPDPPQNVMDPQHWLQPHPKKETDTIIEFEGNVPKYVPM